MCIKYKEREREILWERKETRIMKIVRSYSKMFQKINNRLESKKENQNAATMLMNNIEIKLVL